MKARWPMTIRGTGSYLPERVVTNEYFEKYLDTSDEWIVTRTGISTRRWAAPDETTSTMAIHAARLALEDAGIGVNEIDVIICATATPDYPLPSTAALIQAELCTKPVPAFDVSAACAGFLYAINVAAGLLASNMYRHALVVGAETLSRVTNFQDRTTAILFGDAAGVAVLSADANGDEDDQGVLYANASCDGRHAKLIWTPGGGSRRPASDTTVAENLHCIQMRGREVYKVAVQKMMEMIDGALKETGLTPNDLKLVIPHQSNLRIIESVRQKLGLPSEKIAVNIDRCGNTSSASIPVLLDEARRTGAVKKGDIVMLMAIGAGLAWGSMIIRL